MAATTEKRIGVCNLCEAICGLELTLDRRRRHRRCAATPTTRSRAGTSAPRAWRIADVYTDPDRLRRPVRRVDRPTDRGRRSAGTRRSTWWPTGSPASIERARARRARHLPRQPQRAQPRLDDPRRRDGQGAAAPATASAPPRSTSSPHQLVAHLMFGHQLLLPIPDLDRTSYFLVFGANPMASNGSLMTVPDFPRPAARRSRPAAAGWWSSTRGAPRPRRSPTSTTSSGPAPTRSCCWRCSHVVLDEGLGTAPPAYVDGLAAVEAAVAPYTPELAEEHSGVPADEIRRVARELAGADRAAAYGRIGVSTQALRLGLRVGDQLPQPPDRQPRPRRRRDVHRPGHRRRRDRADRARPLRPVASPGPRPARDRRRAAGVDAARRDRDARATGRSGRC